MNRTQQILLFGIIGVVIFAVMVFVFGIGKKPSAPPPVTITFWGVEDERIWNEILREFKNQDAYAHITVEYRQIEEDRFEGTLINRLAEGTGPDVFLLKNSWIEKHRDKIAPLPQEIFQFRARNFQDIFVDGAAADLIVQDSKNPNIPPGSIVGLPIYLDTLAVYYDKDQLNTAGISLFPDTWDDVAALTQTLTARDAIGNITRSGAAFGTFRNVENAFEIVSALMLQNGNAIVNRATKQIALGADAADALSFYASFADRRSPNFSWTDRMQSSLTALAEGDAVFALGFARDYGRILAKNPHISLGIAPFPQPKDARAALTYGSYFFPAVSKLSRNQIAAWQFVFYLASRDAAKKYLAETGLPPARRDLIAAGDPQGKFDIFYNQSLTARSWPVPNEEASKKIFQDAVVGLNSRTLKPNEAINKIEQQLRLLVQ